MSRAYAVAETVSVKKSLGLATLMIVSIFAGITYAPTVSATVSGDLEITTSILIAQILANRFPISYLVAV